MSSSADNSTPDSASSEQGFVSHLMELRDRLIRIVLVILILFGVAFTFWTDIYDFLSAMAKAIDGRSNIAWQNLRPAGGFFTAIRLSMATAFFIAMPFIFHQLWKFVSPGLYKHEKKLVMPILFGGIALFYCGVLFARYVVLPIFYGFAEYFVPGDAKNIFDIMYYLDFNIKMFFAFGIAFQVPIVTIVLVWGGISTPESLKEKRPYVIVGAFVVGMLLTPPDVISQILLAIPMWFLFEAGILVSKMYYKPKDDDEDDDDEPDDEEPGPGGSKPGPGGSSPSNDATRVSSVIPGSAAAAATAADQLSGNEDNPVDKDVSDGDEQDSGDGFPDEVDSLVISSEGAGMDYPYDYKPLSEEELDAELDRFDEEMDALDSEDESQKTDSSHETSDDKNDPSTQSDNDKAK